MTDVTLRRALVVAALVPLLGACGGGTSPGGSTGKVCGTLPTADPAAALPSGFPALSGQVLYGPASQGKTTIVFALVAEESFVAVRDDLVTRLTSAGYRIVGTDQESVEAEAEFAGAQDGTIKVQSLCEGHTTVRYKFNG